MASKKVIIGISFIVFIVGGYSFVIYGTNIPELMEKQQQYEESRIISSCDGINDNSDIDCITERAKTIDKDKEVCASNPNSYYPETIEKCKSVLGLD